MNYFSHNVRKLTFGHRRPAKFQISLRIRAVWSESSLGAFWIANDAWFLHRRGNRSLSSRKHAYNMLTPLNPHFYVVKLWFQGYALFFLFLLKNIDCGYSLEPPRRGGLTSAHNLCFEQKYEKISEFLSENFHFLVVKLSIYLNSLFS